jgi:D-alanine-D-alanine ligase
MRIAVLMHESLVPPETMEGFSEDEIANWKTEFDVTATLRELGHQVQPLGILDDLGVIREAIASLRPHIFFNLCEEFLGVSSYDHHIVSYLELMKQRYTGCNPRGLLLARDKALSKKLFRFHKILTPDFFTVSRTAKAIRPHKLKYPLLVKTSNEDASFGISQSSVVYDKASLEERVSYIVEQLNTTALVESYIEGREFYVGVMGNKRLTTFPVWELVFRNPKEGVPNIASEKAKWDDAYRKKFGIDTEAAKNLGDSTTKRVWQACRKAYRVLSLSGYARMDLRMDEDENIFLIEANPNPNLSYGEDFPESAEHAGISYEQLLTNIVGLGQRYNPMTRMNPIT